MDVVSKIVVAVLLVLIGVLNYFVTDNKVDSAVVPTIFLVLLFA